MTTENLANIGRRLIILMMIDRASRSKLLVHLHLMMKRGKIVAKSLGELMIRHQHTYSTLTCRSHDVQLSAVVRPRDYEFSCSSSPPIPLRFGKSRKRFAYHPAHDHPPPPPHPDVAVDRVVKWLGCGEYSPLGGLVRGLYEGSPAPSKGLGSANEAAGAAAAAAGWGVDMAAEEFIERFYRELRLQKMDVVNKKLRG